MTIYETKSVDSITIDGKHYKMGGLYQSHDGKIYTDPLLFRHRGWRAKVNKKKSVHIWKDGAGGAGGESFCYILYKGDVEISQWTYKHTDIGVESAIRKIDKIEDNTSFIHKSIDYLKYYSIPISVLLFILVEFPEALLNIIELIKYLKGEPNDN